MTRSDAGARALADLGAAVARVSAFDAPAVERALWNLCAVKASEEDRQCDPGLRPLAISTLRGQFADNREWLADPARPTIIVGTATSAA